MLLSGWVKSRLWVSEPLICLAVGVLMGPVVLDLASLDVRSEPGNVFVNQAARISIMGAALRLPEGYVARHWPELAVILGLGMPLMWLSASAVAWLFFPLPVLTALLLGAILAPTDPVLADSIVTGTIADESIPARMRDSITAESGSNDGLGLLFVLLPVSLMTHPTGEAITHWVLTTLLWEIVGGLLIGATVGWFAGRCVDWAYD